MAEAACGEGETQTDRLLVALRGRVFRWVLFVLVGFGVVVWASGQNAADPDDVPRVDESHGRTAHRLIESWVQRGGVPGERAAAVRVAGVMGVRVTLRLDGVSLGQGTNVRADLVERLTAAGPGQPWEALPPIDLIELIEPATSVALADAVDAVKRQNFEARQRAVDAGGQEAQRTKIDAKTLGPQLNVDVQIGYRPEQIVIDADAPVETIYARYAPGFHGLFTLPDDSGVEATETLVWPATVLASNASPRRQIVRLLTRSGLEPDDEELLGRADGVVAGRFEVLHLVRPTRDLPLMRLVRGGQLLPGRFVDEQTLADMADRIALHLFNRSIGLRGQFRGSYLPARGIYRPELASDLDAALTAYALMRFYDRKQRDGNNDQFFQAMVGAGQRAVDAVVGRMLGPETSPDPVTAAFCLLAVLEAPAGTFDPALADRVATVLLGMVGDDSHVYADPADPATRQRSAAAAAVIAAIGGWYERTREPAVGETLAAALEALWTEQQGRFDVNTLPWIALVHVETAGLLEDAGLLNAETRQRRSDDLAAMNAVIDSAELQVVERPELGPADVEGGIVLAPAPDGSPPNPSWQTAQIFSFMATTLRDEQIVSLRERPGFLVTASAAARFLGQLMIDDPNCFAIRSPEEAVGGIRLTLWDNTLDLAPSAITLMALLEMRETLDVLNAGDAVAGDPQ